MASLGTSFEIVFDRAGQRDSRNRNFSLPFHRMHPRVEKRSDGETWGILHTIFIHFPVSARRQLRLGNGRAHGQGCW